MSSLEQKTCGKCGQPFGCGANSTEEDCWCASLPPVLAEPDRQLDCSCPKCLGEIVQVHAPPSGPEFAGASPVETSKCERPLVENEDYYREDATIVFTALYHLRRGYCCDSDCRHCPYGDAIESGRG